MSQPVDMREVDDLVRSGGPACPDLRCDHEHCHNIRHARRRAEEDAAGSDVSTFVDKAMYEAAPMDGTDIKVSLISATPDPLGAIAAACRMYEGKPTYDLGEVTDEERRNAWQQVQETHLKAPLEFVDLHFFIEGVTRAFTHQMVRQRTAVFAQESMRFAVKARGEGAPAARPGPMIASDRGSRQLWEHAMSEAWTRYEALIANGVPAEEARGVLPHDTLTRLNYKTNLRNLLDHAGNRLCTQAQFEWRVVFIGIVKAISEQDALVMGYNTDAASYQSSAPDGNGWQWELIASSGVFKPVCFQLGHCPFNASFDRGCTIRPRVEQGKFDEIKPEEWLSDPTAGWVR
jgi:thymidylate synthase (FAD)